MINKKTLYLLCLPLLMLTGCWDRIEVNDMALVTGIGIDQADNKEIEVSVQIIIPTGQNASQKESTIVEVGTGQTITDAISKIQQKVSREIFMGHNSVVFISEKVAEQGIRNYVDVFARHPFGRIRTNVFVTKDNPIDILEITPDLEKSSSEVARKLVKSKTGISVTMKELLQMMDVKEKGAALPMLEIDEIPASRENLAMSGTAIFNDDKLVGELDNTMTRGLQWIRNEVERARITIEPEDGEGMITFQILKAKSELIPKIEKGTWKITVKTTSVDDVIENNSNLNLMDPEITKKLEKEMGKKIEQRIFDAVAYIQKELQTDVFGFDQAFHRHYPNEFAKIKDNWPEIFVEIEIDVQSSVDIDRPGRSTYPQGIPENEVIR